MYGFVKKNVNEPAVVTIDHVCFCQKDFFREIEAVVVVVV